MNLEVFYPQLRALLPDLRPRLSFWVVITRVPVPISIAHMGSGIPSALKFSGPPHTPFKKCTVKSR